MPTFYVVQTPGFPPNPLTEREYLGTMHVFKREMMCGDRLALIALATFKAAVKVEAESAAAAVAAVKGEGA